MTVQETKQKTGNETGWVGVLKITGKQKPNRKSQQKNVGDISHNNQRVKDNRRVDNK